MPDPVPVVVLSRLVIATSHLGQWLGRALFQDGVQRVLESTDAICILGVVVRGLSQEAKAFYLASVWMDLRSIPGR